MDLLSYNQSLTNFNLKPLKKEKLYTALVRSRTKKEIEMEIKTMTLSQRSSYTTLLKSIENRFWLYDKVLPQKGQSYTLSFKSFETMLFNNDKKKLINLNSLTYAYSARKHNLEDKKTFPLIKSRLLVLTKRGLKLNFYGLGLVLKTLVFKAKKNKIKKKVSYRSWLILNLNFIGFLSSFQIRSWKLKFLKPKKKKKRFFDKKWHYYYQGNLAFKSIISIKKN